MNVEDYPHIAEQLFTDGTLLYEAKKYREAVKKLKEALNYQPDSEDIAYNLALGYLEMQKYRAARKCIQKIKTLDCKELISELDRREGKKSYQEYCPFCIKFNSDSGICDKIHRKIPEYPKQFIKKCNGSLFKPDPNKPSDLSSSRDKDKPESSPVEKTENIPSLVELYRTRDISRVTLIQSAFKESNIDYAMYNERYHRMRTAILPVMFLVREDQASMALSLLEEMGFLSQSQRQAGS